jgi:nucleoside-diphosphate-sugar epimerase
MKRVLVTGGTGFLGAALARLLVDEGYEVAALIRASSNPWRLGAYFDKVKVIRGRLDEPSSYCRAVREFAGDTVMHLGWHGVAKQYRNDLSQVRINVCGSVELFHIACDAGCKTFIGAGSQAEYGFMTTQVNESSPTQPLTLYGAAKLATYTMLCQMAKERRVRFAWLRVFSVYGPQDDDSTLVSSLIRDFVARRCPSVTNAEQLWDYLYIDDAARAFREVGRVDAAGLFNIGSGKAPPLRETICQIRDIIDPALPIGFGEVPQPATGALSLQPSIARICELTAWRPKVSLAEGIAKTVAAHPRVSEHGSEG